ncbi:MAG TPA: PBP1A family penicillin-binding protein, partial [Blastocatellia bacterium]|nr:PBP1A family penicillin-binding protein [Blastocatellia bacterium]
MARQDIQYLTWRQAPFKRAYYHATSRIILAPMLIIVLILIGALFYYYNRYSAIIDAGLRGDIFVRSSGIYAAPLTLRDNAGALLNDVVNHLRKVGYQPGPQVANDKRGHYSVRNNTLDIYPGADTKIDGEKAFPNLRVVFGSNGKGIQTLVDMDSQQRLGQAQVEPELISSVVNQDREKRKIIEFKDLPKNLVDAITAIEDRQFFEHSGINWRGVIRALFVDIQAGELKEGGSSITQQLVKNFFLKPDPTFKRKLSEAYMSIILEQRLTKEEIMAMYCNQIYLGQRAGFSINGFGEAARAYFGKDVSHLALHESAMLAGIIQGPNSLSPFTHEERARERRNKVLDDMVASDKITRDQAESSKAMKLGVVGGRSGAVDVSDAPYFIDYLTRQVEKQYDQGERGGSLRSLRIYSTIDLELQQAAYQAVSKNMIEVERLLAKRKQGLEGLQAAVVAMNAKTGEIVAMVGGRDYSKSQLNRATDARRQPGSVFKPFVYATAISAGGDHVNNPITTATTFVDEPKEFENGSKPWAPSNFGDRFEMRPMTVRDALVQSKNVITVEIAQIIGYGNVARMAEKAGLTKVPQVPSMALGVAEATPLQMASAYTTFANQGRRVLPIAVKRVTTKDGSTLLESKTETREVMSPQVAYIMTSIMQDVLDHGTGTRVRQMGFAGEAAGKTGSSRDAWFAGYTRNLVCVVWVGFDDNSDIGLTGSVAAAPIWADFMTLAMRKRPELGGSFEDPGDLVIYDIDPATGAAAQGETIGARREIFLRGTEPGGGQAMPDFSVPRAEPSSSSDGAAPRSAPTPRTSDGDARTSAEVGGLDPRMIPLPPDARKIRPRPTIEPGTEPTPVPKRTFGSRLKDFFGLGSPADAKPSPTPTPTPLIPRREGAFSPAPSPAPRTSPTPRLIALDTVRATTTTVTPRPKPPPGAQVATRPRTMEERKQSEKPAAKTTSDSRAAKPDQGKLGASKINDTAKNSVKKEDGKSAEKKTTPKSEIKAPAKQPEVNKTGNQIAKSSTPAPTPKPS